MATPPSIFGVDDVLERTALLSALPDNDRAALVEKSIRRRYEPSAPLFHAGDPGTAIIAILSGQVRVVMPGAAGHDAILADLAAGDVLGEIAVLDGGVRSADVVALTKVEVLAIPRTVILEVLAKNPDAMLKVLSRLAGMIRRSDQRLLDVAFGTFPMRLARVLIDAHDRLTTTRKRISLSQSDLARMAFGSRESVNRQLSEWRRRGLVELSEGWIILLKPDEIRAQTTP